LREQISKSPEVSDVKKSIFQFSLSRNLSISLQYVPSRNNPVDSPSRTLSDLYASLDIRPLNLVDSTFGPHTIDLMALPSNIKSDRSGCPLKFFSPFPCVQVQGTNVQRKRLCVSPFNLIGSLLKYLASQPCPFTMSRPENTGGPSSSVRLPLHSNWAKRGIIQFFYSLLKQAFLLRKSDHFNGIFGYFALLLLYNLT